MKNPLIIMAFALCLSSCEKAEQEDKEAARGAEKIPVSFTAEGFQQSVKEYGATASDLGLAREHLNYLYYYVFDADGKKVSSKVQIKGSTSNFGLIKDSLATGEYQSVFIGSTKPLSFNISNFEESHLEYTANSDNDVFYLLQPLTVLSTPYQESLDLPRITGKLTYIIKDVIPANVAAIKIIRSTSSFYYFSGSVPASEDSEYTIKLPAGHGPMTLDPLTLLALEDRGSTNLNIIAYDAANNVIANKAVSTHKAKGNKEVIVSGNLFTEYPSFILNVDKDWSGDKEYINLP